MAATSTVPSLLYRTATRTTANSIYVCRSCLLQTSRQVRRASNRNLPWTEKIRRKIWGTDNPPGLADPYGGPSFLEKRRMRKQQQEATEEELAEAEAQLEAEEQERDAFKGRNGRRGEDVLREEATKGDVAPTGEYKPAKNWDGLMHVGHMGDWKDTDPTEADDYEPWIINEDSTASDPDVSTEDQAPGDLYKAAQEAGLEIPQDELLGSKLDFKDPITFQVIKAFQKRTATRLPDPKLNKLAQTSNATYRDMLKVYVQLVDKSAPANLYEELSVNDTLMSQGNVMVLPRRETPVDKEKEVGRWKVIEKELTERGLPVLGRAHGS